MLHKGHINLLREMRKIGARVDVMIHDDVSIFQNKGKFPVQYVEHRKRNLRKSELVNYIFETKCKDPSKEIETYLNVKMHDGKKIAYMRGNDWKDFPGKEILEKYNIPIIYIDYTDDISSSMLRDEIS